MFRQNLKSINHKVPHPITPFPVFPLRLLRSRYGGNPTPQGAARGEGPQSFSSSEGVEDINGKYFSSGIIPFSFCVLF
jgi:hypothetical protein